MMKNILHSLVLVFLITVTMSVGSLSNIRLRKNLFHHIHRSIQDIVNKFFQLLHLNNNFTNMNNNRKLLLMHAAMKTITEHRFLKYKAAKKLVKLKKSRKHKKGNPNLEKLIHVVVDETLTPDETDSKNQTKKTGIKLKFTSVEIPENSEESIYFLNQYLHYVEGFDVFNFELPVQRTKEFYKQKKNRDASSSNKVINQGLSRRVFDGYPANSAKYPFIASVHVLGNYTCTATIVLKDWILTAATCLHIAYNDNSFIATYPTGITVRIGSDYTEHSGDLCTAKEIVFHPEYTPEILQNNLAMIKFDKLCAQKTSKKIRRIVYQNSNRNNPDNILLLGWAKASNKIHYFDPLLSTRLDFYEIERCKVVYSSKYVSEKNFCAGYPKKGSGACQRDVGGPGIVKNILAGVVSFAPPICGTPDAPTVFTNISLYTEWIDNFSRKKQQETSIAPIISTIKESLTLRKKYKNVFKLRRKHSNALTSKLINHLLSRHDLDQMALEGLYDTDIGSIEIDIKKVPMSDKQENIYLNNPQIIKSYPHELKTNLRQLSSSDEIKSSKPIPQNFGNANPGNGENLQHLLEMKQLQKYLGFDNLMEITTAASKYTETTTLSVKYLYREPNGSSTPWKRDVAEEFKAMHTLSPADEKLEEYLGPSESDSSESESEYGMSIDVPPETITEDGLTFVYGIDTPTHPLAWILNTDQNEKMFQDKTKTRFSLQGN